MVECRHIEEVRRRPRAYAVEGGITVSEALEEVPAEHFGLKKDEEV